MTSLASKRKGHCLCGAVTFEFTPAEAHFDACHCGMCRRWNGGPALTVRAQEGAEISGREHIATYKSSEWGERQFCKQCGTHLFVAAPAFNYFGVSLGALENLDGLAFAMEIFVDCKPDAYDFANDTRRLTEAEFLAMVSAAPEQE